MMNRRGRNHASFTVLFERVRKIKSREREGSNVVYFDKSREIDREIFGLKRIKLGIFAGAFSR